MTNELSRVWNRLKQKIRPTPLDEDYSPYLPELQWGQYDLSDATSLLSFRPARIATK